MSNSSIEEADILLPPTFKKTGAVKNRKGSLDCTDWIGTFNLWIIQDGDIPSIVYQVRSPNASWAPNKFDVTAGGHYLVGESLLDGLREVEEELGKVYEAKDLSYIGQKLNVSPDTKGNMRHEIVDISFIKDNSSLTSYSLQEEEVYGVCTIPISELLLIHTEKDCSYKTQLIRFDGEFEDVTVDKSSFPSNWDRYHFKIAILADRYIKGEANLIY